MGGLAAASPGGSLLPTAGLADRTFICHNFDAYYSASQFHILPYLWHAADLLDLTGRSVGAPVYPVNTSASSPTVVSLFTNDGKVEEWFRLSNGGNTSDSFNLKEQWWVPLLTFSYNTGAGERAILTRPGSIISIPVRKRRFWRIGR